MKTDLNEFDEDDPRTTWQNQTTETTKMSLILIRQKARELRSRRRRQMLGTIVVPLVASFFYAFSIKQFPHLQPMLHCLFVLTMVWSLLGVYFQNRKKSPGDLPANAGLNTGLEFCRQQIERQLSNFRHLLLWSLGPILLSIGTFVLALAANTSLFPKVVPFIILVVVWVVAFLSIGVQQRRGLEREFAELTELAKGNS